MVRITLCLLLLFVGCSSDPSADLSRFDLEAKAGAIANQAFSGAKDYGSEVTPTPGPTPGEKCPTCDGTGKVGDGVVFSKCLECDGTGITPQPKTE